MPRHPGNLLASRILRVIRVRPIGSSNRENPVVHLLSPPPQKLCRSLVCLAASEVVQGIGLYRCLRSCASFVSAASEVVQVIGLSRCLRSCAGNWNVAVSIHNEDLYSDMNSFRFGKDTAFIKYVQKFHGIMYLICSVENTILQRTAPLSFDQLQLYRRPLTIAVAFSATVICGDFLCRLINVFVVAKEEVNGRVTNKSHWLKSRETLDESKSQQQQSIPNVVPQREIWGRSQLNSSPCILGVIVVNRSCFISPSASLRF
ncbi:hypothetical protein KY285_027770 [Solanum tuberosum]|nr:hypothetical protein KY285_027770 [Solanum tuberosum]